MIFRKIAGIFRRPDPPRPARVNINTDTYWDGIWTNEGFGSRNSRIRKEHVCELVPEGSKVLDVGCGNGQVLRKLREKGCDCHGTDFSDIHFPALRELGIKCTKSFLPAIPFDDGEFDCVVSTEVLEHIDCCDLTLKNIHRVLKDDGCMIVTVPDGRIWKAGGEHINAFNASELSDLLRPYIYPVNLRLFVADGYPFIMAYGKKYSTKIFFEKLFREVTDELYGHTTDATDCKTAEDKTAPEP